MKFEVYGKITLLFYMKKTYLSGVYINHFNIFAIINV